MVEYATGGAIAATAPNPCGTPTGNHNLTREILNKIYLENERVLGKVVYDAKCRIISTYFPVDSLYGPAVLNNLVGDPALRLKYENIVGVQETRSPVKEQRFFKSINRAIDVPVAGGIAIWNVTGRCVLVDPYVPAGLQIDLPVGVYFVRLHSRCHDVFEKVVVVGR